VLFLDPRRTASSSSNDSLGHKWPANKLLVAVRGAPGGAGCAAVDTAPRAFRRRRVRDPLRGTSAAEPPGDRESPSGSSAELRRPVSAIDNDEGFRGTRAVGNRRSHREGFVSAPGPNGAVSATRTRRLYRRQGSVGAAAVYEGLSNDQMARARRAPHGDRGTPLHRALDSRRVRHALPADRAHDELGRSTVVEAASGTPAGPITPRPLGWFMPV